MSSSEWNRRVKGWPGWIALLFVVVGLVAFGATRDTGPRTPDERIESISKRLACPVCQGESVYESRNTASNSSSCSRPRDSWVSSGKPRAARYARW